MRRFIQFKYILLLCTLLLTLHGCIKNDVPYPYTPLEILSFKVRGQIGNSIINTTDRTVTLEVADTVLLGEVKIEKMEVTSGAASTIQEGNIINLASPLSVLLSYYQDFTWTITAKQTINRKFSVEGQIGEPVFDLASKRAIAYVTKQTDLTNINIEELQLGPSTSVITPGIESLKDFTQKRTVIMMFKNIMEEWSLFVFQKDVSVGTDAAIPWVKVAHLYGFGSADSVKRFEIKEKNAANWSTVDTKYITTSGGSVSAVVPHLNANTTYVYRTLSGTAVGNEVEFTTYPATALPNGSFDDWNLENNKIWNPWAAGSTPIWSTANKGASTLGESNTTPSDDIWSGKNSGKSARLETRFVGIGPLGKLAAGNLFIGDFVALDGTNGILAFGKPYTSFPTVFRGKFKFSTSPINYADSRFTSYLGEPDTCTMYIALTDWDEQLEIRTKPSNRKLFDPNDPKIIAYSEINVGYNVNEFTDLELKLEYRTLTRQPKYILVVCSASKYGDYFTGGTGTTLWVDEFELGFDLDE